MHAHCSALVECGGETEGHPPSATQCSARAASPAAAARPARRPSPSSRPSTPPARAGAPPAAPRAPHCGTSSSGRALHRGAAGKGGVNESNAGCVRIDSFGKLQLTYLFARIASGSWGASELNGPLHREEARTTRLYPTARWTSARRCPPSSLSRNSTAARV